jgi:TolB-like protein
LAKPKCTAVWRPLRSIAVLPFKPLVSSQRDESLEIGMADSLITQLSALKQVPVRPLSAVRKYSNPEQDAVIAGKALSVDSVLDGSIQKAGDQLRVTVRLLRVSDGSTIWTERFDAKYTDIFPCRTRYRRKWRQL